MSTLSGAPRFIDQIYDRMVAEIADGTLKAGQRISQEELAEHFQVSRQPVSHAIELLRRQSLVRDAGRKGIEVTPIDPAYVRSLYEVRMVIERLAVRLSAQRIAAGMVDAALIADAQAKLCHGQSLLGDVEYVATEQIVELIHADVAFHTSIYRMSGNPAIEEILIPQWLHFRRAMVTILHSPAAKRRAWQIHAQILDRILSGDQDGAEAAIAGHGEDTVAAIENRL